MIEEELYRETLLDVFQNPKNRGEIPNADIEARLVNPLCGDEVKIQLRMENSEFRIINKAVFSGSGCAISQAGTSLLAENIEGKTLGEIKKLKPDDILKLIGISPSPARLGCALLGLEVLMRAVKNDSKS